MRRLPSGQIVYDPRGSVTIETTNLATRPARLEGIRLGVLDNSKWNASRLLRAVVRLLERPHHFGGVTFYNKESFSRVAPEELIDRICAENEVVLTAIGD
jgi:hypothetical protein